MKKLIISILLFVVCKVGMGQVAPIGTPYPINQNLGRTASTLVSTNSIRFDQGVILGVFHDTTQANLLPYLKNYPGTLILVDTNVVLLRDRTATRWMYIPTEGQIIDGDTVHYLIRVDRRPGTDSVFGKYYNGISHTSYETFQFIDSSGGSGGAWSLTGNSGTTAGTNFIGTTDGQDVVFKANGAEVMRAAQSNGYIGINQSTPTARLNVKTNDIQTAINDSAGLFLENATAATNSVTRQYSPAIVWGGSAWKNTGAQSHRWRAFVQTTNTTVSAAQSTWKLQTNQAGNGYFDIMTILSGSGQVSNLQVFQYNSTVLGRINSVLMGQNSGLYYGTVIPSAASGTGNTGVGLNVLGAVTTGGFNTALGEGVMTVNTTGQINTGVGYHALQANIDGYSNVAIGSNAGLVNTSGFQNTFVGAGAGEAHTTGQENTFIGYDAGLNATTGIRNVYLGWNARAGTDGSNNVMVGYRAGFSLTAGNTTNIFIGSQAGDNASQKVDAVNSIAIGQGTFTTANNQIILGNTSILETRLRGAIYFDGDAGTSGYLLKSNGTGSAPTWVTPASVAPTWQQTLTAGSILNTDNDIDVNGNDLFFNNAHELDLTTSSTGNNGLIYLASSSTNGRTSNISIRPDSIFINPGLSNLIIDSLSNRAGQNAIIGWDSTGSDRGQVGYVTIGSGLSLSSGVLSSTGGSAAGNYGNLQINRNGAFATPGSDSLDFESVTGLSVKGDIHTTGSFLTPNSGYVTDAGFTTKFGQGTTWMEEAFSNLNFISANTYMGNFSTTGFAVSSTGLGYVAATSTLQSVGSFATGYVAKTGTYTATASDYTIECTANTFTVTLPTAVGCSGRMYFITNSGAGTITVGTTSSQVFRNVVATPTTLTLATLTGVMLQSNGADWLKMNGF